MQNGLIHMTRKLVYWPSMILIGGVHYWKKPTQKSMVVMIKLPLVALKQSWKDSLVVMHW